MSGDRSWLRPVLEAIEAGPLTVVGRSAATVRGVKAALVVLDFKAGGKQPTSGPPLQLPKATTYLCQLEAYRRVLAAAGKRVVEVGLVYPRAPAWLRFPIQEG